jgi:hypothetical protein
MHHVKPVQFFAVVAGKASYPCNRPWRPIDLWEVEPPTFSRQSAHRWRSDCQPYAPVTLHTQEDSWYSFLLEKLHNFRNIISLLYFIMYRNIKILGSKYLFQTYNKWSENRCHREVILNYILMTSHLRSFWIRLLRAADLESFKILSQ